MSKMTPPTTATYNKEDYKHLLYSFEKLEKELEETNRKLRNAYEFVNKINKANEILIPDGHISKIFDSPIESVFISGNIPGMYNITIQMK